ncbi:MAG: PAS domain S-box protein, partial [Proteobacteria bacterium]
MGTYKDLCELGSEVVSNHDREKLVRSNSMAVFIFASGLAHAMVYLILGVAPIAALIVICSAANLLVLVLNGAGYLKAARYFQSYCFTIVIAFMSFAVGYHAGATLMFLPALTIVFLNFDLKEKKSLLFVLATTSLVAVAVDIEIEKVVPLFEVTQSSLPYLRIASRLGSLFVLFGQLFVFTKSIAASNRQLSETSSNVVAILESLKESFYFVDRNWIILHANVAASAAVKTMTGFGDSLPGRHFFNMHPYMREQRYAAALLRAMETDTPFREEYWVERTQTWYELSAQPGPLGMSIMYRNINDRRKAEEAVRESEQLQSALFAQAATGLMLTSASGHFVRVNAEIIRLLGYSEQEMLGLSITDICFAEDSADDQAVAVKLLSGEAMNYKSQRSYRHKNGDAIFVSAQGNIIRDAQGNVANFIISVQDLTEAKHAEQKLIQASKMSSLGEMAGSIAHEINSPLTVIALSAEQLEMAAMDETVDADSVARISGRITETVNRITKIIRGLKSFSRNAELDPMVVTTLSSLVGDTLELCREKFRYKGVDLRVGAIPDVNLICRPTELSQVL